MELPRFRYHPNPIETGSVVASDTPCRCCGRARGCIYSGPVYSREELIECICPWCIASGEAHERFNAEFTDRAGIGGYGLWERVPVSILEEVAFRTPGFLGWQQESWWTHCGDAAAFLGPAGKAEVLAYGEALQEVLREEAGLTEALWESYLRALTKEGMPTAYVFRCLHCGALGGYSDST